MLKKLRTSSFIITLALITISFYVLIVPLVDILFGVSPIPPVVTPTQAPTNMSTVTATPTLQPCTSVQIVSPRVEIEPNAATNKIDSETVIQWVPSNCVLIVQTYQNNNLMSQTKDVVSGTSLKFGEPGSGKTKIKVWWNEYSQSTWVTIK